MGRDVGEAIGPERQDQRRRCLVLGERAEERVAFRGVLAEREDFLALVDTSVGVGPDRGIAAASAATGCTPGVITTTRDRRGAGRRRRRRGRARTCRTRTARRRRGPSCRPAVAGRRRPRRRDRRTVGVVDVVRLEALVWAHRARLGSALSTTSDGSWRRIACSKAATSGPGSRPSSRSSTERSWRSERSDSPCRPAWYCAVASSAQRRSRNGASATSAWALARTLSCRPARSGGLDVQLVGGVPQLGQPGRLDPRRRPICRTRPAAALATAPARRRGQSAERSGSSAASSSRARVTARSNR